MPCTAPQSRCSRSSGGSRSSTRSCLRRLLHRQQQRPRRQSESTATQRFARHQRPRCRIMCLWTIPTWRVARRSGVAALSTQWRVVLTHVVALDFSCCPGSSGTVCHSVPASIHPTNYVRACVCSRVHRASQKVVDKSKRTGSKAATPAAAAAAAAAATAAAATPSSDSSSDARLMQLLAEHNRKFKKTTYEPRQHGVRDVKKVCVCVRARATFTPPGTYLHRTLWYYDVTTPPMPVRLAVGAPHWKALLRAVSALPRRS
jgi:hypothetical protein